MSVDGETGLAELPVGGLAPSAPLNVHEDLVTDIDRGRRDAALKRITDACHAAIRGELPRDYEPGHGMPERLCVAAIQLVLDYAHGSTIAELSETYGYHPVYARQLVNHPDAVTIMSLLVGARSDKMLDMASRIAALAPEALTVKVGIMRTATRSELRDKIATDILGMAGYGERKNFHIDQKVEHKVVLPLAAASALRDALLESRRIGPVDYSRFVAGSSEGENAQVALQLGPGQTDAGSLPTAPQTSTVLVEQVA